MKADLISLDAARAERAQPAARAPGREAASAYEQATALLMGVGLVFIACGIVATALWVAWVLAELIS